MTWCRRKIPIFPRQNKKTTRQSGHKNSEQQIVTSVIKRMEKRKQPKYLAGVFNNTVSSTSVFTDLTGGIAQGTTMYQRIGQSIRVQNISLKGILTSVDATQVMRIIIFKWLVSDTSDAPSVSELLDTAGGTIPDYVAQRLVYRPSRFSILWDKTWTFSSNWQPVQHFDHIVKLNSEIEFDVGVNTGKNHVYMLTVSDSAVSTHPSAIISTTVHYHDTE